MRYSRHEAVTAMKSKNMIIVIMPTYSLAESCRSLRITSSEYTKGESAGNRTHASVVLLFGFDVLTAVTMGRAI
jgi:hypothetical protein